MTMSKTDFNLEKDALISGRFDHLFFESDDISISFLKAMACSHPDEFQARKEYVVRPAPVGTPLQIRRLIRSTIGGA